MLFVPFLLYLLMPIQAVRDPVKELEQWLALPLEKRPVLEKEQFVQQPLTRAQAEKARQLLVEDDLKQTRLLYEKEWKERAITLGQLTMKFDVRRFGDMPTSGRSLFISMHGGGNTAKATNDQQWENQKRLYQPAEGIYIAPRAPNDAWDMWFQPHMDAFFSRLIQDAVVFEGVDVNRVYIMGYSAGGDGVFRLAPRLADRWAAAAMMAGHPGDVRADNLRNLPFTLHMGENDKAYERNKRATEWKKLLDDLHEQDREGYVHEVVIQPGMGHWMQRKDAIAIPWMARFTRNTIPKKVVWTDPRQKSFYWLAEAVIPMPAPNEKRKPAKIVAQVEGQTIRLTTEDVQKLTIRLRDELLSLDKPIQISNNGKTVFEGNIQRSVLNIMKTLNERHDSGLCFDAEITVSLP